VKNKKEIGKYLADHKKEIKKVQNFQKKMIFRGKLLAAT
jgi:hypothetical protein